MSDTVAGGDYYALLISFADYDTGKIEGKFGKNSGPTSDLLPSGYHRLDETTESSIAIDFGTENCVLLASDYSYKKLEGKLYDKATKTSKDIVFKRA